MRRIDRRHFLAMLSGVIPSVFLSKAAAFPAFSLEKAANSDLGAMVTKSSAIKINQPVLFKGKNADGGSIEVILSRTKSGLIALNGTCTHQGCAVGLRKTKLLCPCHGSVFSALTGTPVMGPNGTSKNTIKPLARYKVTEKSGKIYIK